MKEAIEIMSGDLYRTISQYYPIHFGIISVIRTQKRKWISDIANSLCNALQVIFIIYVNHEL